MGLQTLGRGSCHTNSNRAAVPPNPSPSRWTLLACEQYANGYALKVRYTDCTNYEGVKVMVYRGQYQPRAHLDPHFTESADSPIARYRPDADGWENALVFAFSL